MHVKAAARMTDGLLVSGTPIDRVDLQHSSGGPREDSNDHTGFSTFGVKHRNLNMVLKAAKGSDFTTEITTLEKKAITSGNRPSTIEESNELSLSRHNVETEAKENDGDFVNIVNNAP